MTDKLSITLLVVATYIWTASSQRLRPGAPPSSSSCVCASPGVASELSDLTDLGDALAQLDIDLANLDLDFKRSPAAMSASVSPMSPISPMSPNRQTRTPANTPPGLGISADWQMVGRDVIADDARQPGVSAC